MLYYEISIFIALIALIEIKVNKIRPIYLIFFTVVVFLVFISFARFETGYDYFAYENIYFDSARVDFEELQIEPAYYLYNHIISYFNFPFWFFLFAFTIVSILPKIILIYKSSSYLMLALLIYYVNYYIMYDFGVLRQAAALSFCMMSWNYAINKKPLEFLFLNLIAVCFHSTAIIFLPFYYLCRLRLNYYVFTLILVIAAVGANIVPSLLNYFISSGLTFGFVIDKLAFYSESSEYGSKIGSSIGFIVKILLAFFYLLSVRRNSVNSNSTREYFGIAYLVSLGGFLFLNNYAILAGRLFSYYKIFEIFLFPDLIKLQKNILTKYGVALIVVLIQIYQLDRILNQEYSDVLSPYTLNPYFILF